MSSKIPPPPPPLLLQLLMLLLLLLQQNASATETTLYIMQGKSAEFRCFYDAKIDTISSRELAVSVQSCSQRQDMVVVEQRISELAAVLGGRTFATPAYRAVFSPRAAEPPAFAVNPRHRLLRDGTVRLAHGNATAIVVTIDAAAAAADGSDSLCATCGQAGDTFTYTETKKSVIKIVSPPTVRLSVNGAPPPIQPPFTVTVNEGEPLMIDCVGQGDGEMTARLTKSGRTLAASSTAKVNHSVLATSAPSDSGLYQCQVTSSLAYLVSEGQDTGSANFTLAVSFSPRFELDEVVRFTPLGEREDVQVIVSAFPEAHLSCSYGDEETAASRDGSSNLVTTRESFDPVQYYTVFRVTVSNLDRVNKETRVTCRAVNRLGSRELRLKLTALAPTPEIVSDAATNWWNSYHLRWQHHVKANVDYYHIRVVHLTPSGKVLNVTQKQLDKVQQEAAISTSTGSVSRWNGLVFDLRPDSTHNISLQACNEHGCSQFSDNVRVHTARESVGAFNNPDNPVFAKPQSDQEPDNAAPSQTGGTGKGALAIITGSLFGCLLASQIRLPW